jgi:ATP-dependent exoDNAse (exonuclease V) alpha subunit
LITPKPNVLICEILTGSKKGRTVAIPRIKLLEDKSYTFKLYRHQFPVKLAFAMTINKAQGQTVESIGLNLERDVFAHGQLYVALSRVRSWKNLLIKLAPENIARKVINVVYKEILEQFYGPNTDNDEPTEEIREFHDFDAL